MLNSQKHAIRTSEIRQRLNTIASLDTADVTDEVRTEADTLRGELDSTETQYRAALAVEGREEATARGMFGNGSGEPAEVRALIGRVNIGDYLRPAAARTALSGAPVELAGALGCPFAGPGGGVAVPWEMLETPERRAAIERRAFTDSGDLDGSIIQRPILQRLFGMGVMGSLGVRIDSVPAGRSEWPIITGGVAPAEFAEGTAATAPVVAVFTEATLKPKRLSGRYEFTHEMNAQIPAIEASLRRDLADSVAARMEDRMINGAGGATEPRGFATSIAVPDNAGAEADFGDYAGLHAQAVDGIHASTENEVSSVIGVGVYKHASGVYQAGSGESGSDALKRRSMRCVASPFVGAASNSGHHKLNILHASGPNGGDMRGDSVAAVWPTLELIRDMYTKASQGVVLTYVMLWDSYAALRASAYARVALKVS